MTNVKKATTKTQTVDLNLIQIPSDDRVKPVLLRKSDGSYTERVTILAHLALGATVNEIKALSRKGGLWKGVKDDLGYGYSLKDGIIRLAPTPDIAVSKDNIGVLVKEGGLTRYLTANDGLAIIKTLKNRANYTNDTIADWTLDSLVKESESVDNTL